MSEKTTATRSYFIKELKASDDKIIVKANNGTYLFPERMEKIMEMYKTDYNINSPIEKYDTITGFITVDDPNKLLLAPFMIYIKQAKTDNTAKYTQCEITGGQESTSMEFKGKIYTRIGEMEDVFRLFDENVIRKSE